MKATDLKIGQKYIWRRNSQTTHESVYIGTDDSGKYILYVFEYEKSGNKYYTYLSVHHVDCDISRIMKPTKYISKIIGKVANKGLEINLKNVLSEMRIFKPNEGQIEVWGRDLENWKREHLTPKN